MTHKNVVHFITKPIKQSDIEEIKAKFKTNWPGGLKNFREPNPEHTISTPISNNRIGGTYLRLTQMRDNNLAQITIDSINNYQLWFHLRHHQESA